MAKKADPRVMQAMQALAGGNAHDAESLCRAVLEEKKRDDYKLAVDTELAEVKKGNMNYKGIGLK